MERLVLTSEKLLLVEGRDEVEFFEALFKFMQIDDFQIINVQGKDNFKTHILSLKTLDGFQNVKILGIIRDADNNANDAFKSICNSLKFSDLDYPKDQNTFIEAAIKIGIYIMPGNKDEGMLETLCLETIEESKELQCIEEFFKCIPEQPKNIAKSKIQAYLSTRKKFVHSLGLASKKGYWDFSHIKLDDLKYFIRNFQET